MNNRIIARVIRMFNSGVYSKTISLFAIVAIVAMCVICGLNVSSYVDFVPFNGTFQDYNPIHRLLSGQIPYRDFVDYLGFGHLYCGSFLVAVLGGSYRASLFSFEFLSTVSSAMMFFAIGKSTTKSTPIALCVTLVFLIFDQTMLLQFGGKLSFLTKGLNYLITSGNSARFLRAAILPLVCCGFIICNSLFSKNERFKSAIGKHRLIPTVAYAAVAGFAFHWSNDFGISTWAGMAIMLFVASISRRRNLLYATKILLLEILISILFVIIFAAILSMGHISEWATNIFGTGGYQAWYYNSFKAYYLFDIETSLPTLMQASFAVYYCVMIFRNRGTREALLRYGVPCLMNLTCFIAVQEYRLFSGNYLCEPISIVLLATITFEVVGLIAKSKEKKPLRVAAVSFLVIACFVGAPWAAESVQKNLLDEKDGIFFNELGGNMRQYSADVKAAEAFLGENSTIFSTYATAQEVVSGTFQPSGIDYIIHALGDGKRSEYLLAFETSDYDYAVTQSKENTGWEYWIERANWYLYRELFSNWKPVFANSYEIYWERDNQQTGVLTPDLDLQIRTIDETTVEISIETDERIDGVADVLVDWTTQKKYRLMNRFLLRQMIKIENTGAILDNKTNKGFNYNFLRSEGCEYIPISIIDGKGEVTITGMPEDGVTLSVNSAKCERIFDQEFTYIPYYEYSASDDETVITIGSTPERLEALKSATGIVFDSEIYSISRIKTGKKRVSGESKNVILLTTDAPSEVLSAQRGNMLFLRTKYKNETIEN